eukprot:TRINITY_DN948_c0_g1_i1.p1 TRINITY_DN948_c0_g1~~TRINITY_DN948_c0_g1_i1.p1  ORF type:complete len:345 (+),score=86.96 TRINITY_DN948_c0_g1_i1:690-1724(+)
MERAVAVAGAAGGVQLVDPATFAVLARYETKPACEVYSVHRIPRSTLVAAGLGDGTLLIFDTAQAGGAERVLAGHTDAVSCIATSPDGRFMATASDDHSAIVWRLHSDFAQEHVVTVHGYWVMAVAFNCSSTRLVTASNDYTFAIHDTATWAARVVDSDDQCRALACHPRDPHVFAVGVGGGDVEIRQTETGALIRTFAVARNWIHSVAFDLAGTRLAVGTRSRCAKIVDVASGETLQTLNHNGIVWGAYFSADGELVTTASEDGEMAVWNAQTGAKVSTGDVGALLMVSLPEAAPWLRISGLREACMGKLATKAGGASLKRLPEHLQAEAEERRAKRVRGAES